MNAEQLIPKLRLALRRIQRSKSPDGSSGLCAHCVLLRMPGVRSTDYQVAGKDASFGHFSTREESIACLRASIAALTENK